VNTALRGNGSDFPASNLPDVGAPVAVLTGGPPDGIMLRRGQRVRRDEVHAMRREKTRWLERSPGAVWAVVVTLLATQAADAIYDAAKAAEIELINQVCSEDELESAVDELISHLTALSAPVLRINKRGLLLGMRGGLSELQAMEKLYLDELMALEDAEEGLKAFLEKRKPEWKDR